MSRVFQRAEKRCTGDTNPAVSKGSGHNAGSLRCARSICAVGKYRAGWEGREG